MTNALITRPIRTAFLIIALTLIATLTAFTSLKVEGDVARALKGTSEAFKAFEDLEARFGAPSKDEIYLVRAKDFGDPDTFQALEDLVIDLQLTDGVQAVLSIFALPDPKGDAVSFLARNDIRSLPPADRLKRLDSVSAMAPNLLSQDRSAALLAVMPDFTLLTEARLANLDAVIAAADPALALKSVGLAALQREISKALIADQVFIAPTSTLFCVLIALFLFRSWRAALICALPSTVGLSWTFAAMAVLGYPVDPLMAVIPTILIVLGIADSVHIVHAVQRHAKTDDLGPAIVKGLHETMPAVLLASLTTALAFLCLLFVGSPTVSNLAIVGPIGLALTTLAVYLILPVALLLFFRNAPAGRTRALEFRAVAEAAIRLMCYRVGVSIFALGLLVALLLTQTQTVVGYRLMDHIPRNGDFRATLTELQDLLPGSDQSFVMLDAADPTPGLSEADKALLTRAGAALYGADAGFIPTRDIDGLEHALLTRFQGDDGRTFALPLISRLNVPWTQTIETTRAAEAALHAAGIDGFTVTGYSQMASTELPLVVQELRFAFYFAVALVTGLSALLLRSVRLALLSLVPNLIPILGVEAWLVLTGKPLTITGAIAFTIAFGIAVDDTIHLMNRIRISRRPGGTITRAIIEDALRTTAAPVITTSIILLAGFTVTAFSLMPSVAVFGQLTVAAMALALVADLFLFPSLLDWGGKRGPTT